jgi:hypothetical protein
MTLSIPIENASLTITLWHVSFLSMNLDLMKLELMKKPELLVASSGLG